jgi:ubiquinone/menaquinone biosynthesis C-methylase UbiE
MTLSKEAWHSFFGEDYLLFSEVILSPERTAYELNAIVDCLKLSKGMKILDLGCGQGRMSIALAKKGFDVTGYDGSLQLLEEAKRRAASESLNIAFVLGDMRELDTAEQFDAVINIGTAFGYITDAAADQDILHRVERLLKPGGLFLQETENRDYKLRFLHNTWHVMNERIVFSNRQFDSVSGRWREDICWYEEGEMKNALLDVRLYTATELLRMTEVAGLKVLQVCGGFDLSALTIASPRMLILSKKE